MATNLEYRARESRRQASEAQREIGRQRSRARDENKILCSDWLPELERWTCLSRPDALLKPSLFGHVINRLLNKLVRSRWLDMQPSKLWDKGGRSPKTNFPAVRSGLRRWYKPSSFCVFINVDFISLHKNTRTNMTYMQQSWPVKIG